MANIGISFTCGILCGPFVSEICFLMLACISANITSSSDSSVDTGTSSDLDFSMCAAFLHHIAQVYWQLTFS